MKLIYIHIYSCMNVCVYVWMDARLSVCLSVCIWIYIYAYICANRPQGRNDLKTSYRCLGRNPSLVIEAPSATLIIGSRITE